MPHHPVQFFIFFLNQQLKTKGGKSAKAHWMEESEVEGEQAAHSLEAPFKVVPRPFLVPLHCICL